MTNLPSSLFINTRPVDRAQPLTEALRHEGYGVLELPLLELQACDYSEELDLLFKQLVDVQAIVVVSPTAIQIGMLYLEKSGLSLPELQHIQWIAVGQTTADCLLEYGIQAHVPEVETSEGMLTLPIFQTLDVSNIAFWRGQGGRQFMMQQCLKQQMNVLNFVLYKRALPVSSRHVFQKITDDFSTQTNYRSQYWVCISSEASWNNWKELCLQCPEFINQMHYLVLGQRLYEILQSDRKKQHFCFKITQVEYLNPKDILRAITEFERKS